VCEGTGFCVLVAPDIFELGSKVSHATPDELTDSQKQLAREAAEMCPTRAIQVSAC
jgi:ferredoxin